MTPSDPSRTSDRRLLLEANIAAISKHRELLHLVSHFDADDRISLTEQVSSLLGINEMQADAVLSMQLFSFIPARLNKLQIELRQLDE